MAEAGILAGSEQRVMISDTYLQDNRNANGSSADIDLLTLTPVAAFVGLNNSPQRGIPKSGVNSAFNPRAISLNGTQADDEADFGFVNGIELGDPIAMMMVQRHGCGFNHPNRYKTIRPNGTTGRGVIIHT